MKSDELFITAIYDDQSSLSFTVIRYVPRGLIKGQWIFNTHPIKIRIVTLILKSFPCKEKKMADIISHVMISPLESKVALWEIKAHPFQGVNGISRKSAPVWRHWSPRGFSHYCSVSQLSWSSRGKPTSPQHKAGFVRLSSERPRPHEPEN